MTYLYHLLMSSRVAQLIAKVLASVVLLFTFIKHREKQAVQQHKAEAAREDAHNANRIRKTASDAKSSAVADVATRSGTELDAELHKRGKLRK